MALHAVVQDMGGAGDPAGGAAVAAAGAPRVVKRYVNRKLYDTAASRYVKLEDIAEMVRLGVDVQVVDHRSGKDLTTVALAHIIFSEELKDTTRRSGTLTDLVRTPAAAAAPPESRDGARPRRVDLEAALASAERRVHHLVSQGHRMRAGANAMAAAAEDAVVRLQRAASERVDVAHDVVTGLARLKTELSRIARRIDDLHERLRGLEG